MMIRRFFFVLLFVPLVCQAQFSEQAFKFGKVLDWINHYYVDSVDQEALVEKAIVEMLQELDPHSVYYNKEEVKRMNEPLQGGFEGIGISFNILKDTLFVISTISGGPSEKVGIMAGDRILEVDGENIAGKGIDNSDVFRLLKGPKGTKVDVKIKRRNIRGLLDFTIVRDKIPIYSIDASYKIADGIGYIKLNRFAITTSSEFDEKIKELKKEGVQDLILDLSNNGGGYLEEAISLADQFLDGRKEILYTEGINSPRKEYMASVKGEFEEGRVIIIIDEGSASASEIVAGAIQDWDRGVVVGRRSFGKGLVQRPLMLPDGSMVRLTIARYYTPTGRLIQKSYENGVSDYNNDLINRYNSGELSSADSFHFPDSLKYYTLENKRVVYGGGGIMPDVFVPIDTTFITPYYRSLINKGILNSFVLEYVDKNRGDLTNTYENFDKFNASFQTDDELLSKLTAHGEENSLKFNQEEFETSKDHIRLLMKAYIARDLWNNNEFYIIFNSQEKVIQEALEILQSKNLYKEKLK
ncbi:MAG: S41 family peptidase [Bacteroidales bacterium]|nr:S41 family peptidase [Bacteroidales bacterium]